MNYYTLLNSCLASIHRYDYYAFRKLTIDFSFIHWDSNNNNNNNRSINEKKYKARDIFDYDIHECRVVPDILFKMIREYYPRIDGEAVAYPPPITPEGGDYKYEFPSGNGVDNQGPPYAPGPPHWCTEEYKATGNWDTFCPYVFKGPDAGKVRFLL